MYRYFRPHYLPGFGTLQDGGVRANSPAAVALRESHIIWPSARRPDLVLSIGTGFTPSAVQQEDRPARGILQDGFLPRLFRSLIFSPAVDGERGWQELVDGVSDDLRPDVFRLNLPLREDLPELDAVNRLEELCALPYSVPDEIVHAILATSFFFELDEVPEETSGGYRCRGSILCARANSPGVLRQIGKELPAAQFAIANGPRLGVVEEHDGCPSCGYYRKRVSFVVPTLTETITMRMESSHGQQKIAGFPNPTHWFLENQQIRDVFGRSDHRIGQSPARRVCFCAIGTKRRTVQFVEPALEHKKARLGWPSR